MKHGGIARKKIADASGCGAGDEQGDERPHGEVDHQHFDGEHESCDGGFVNAGDGSRCSTPHEKHDGAVVLMEPTSYAATDSGTREHNGGFSSDRSTKTDGDAGSDNGRPHVVRTDVPLVARDSVKDFGDTMPDVVAHYKLDEECGNDDADYRIDEVEGIGTIDIKVVGEQMLYKMDKPLEKICRYARSYPNQKTKDEDELLVGDATVGELLEPMGHAKMRRRGKRSDALFGAFKKFFGRKRHFRR